MPKQELLYNHLRDLPYFRALVRSVEATFFQRLELPAPTLDLGCGDGHFTSRTFDRKIDVGLDSWQRSIREASQRDCYLLLVEADGGRMPFNSGYFSSAFSNSVLEHIPLVEKVLADISRILKPKAPFYFSVPNPRYLSELSLTPVLGSRYSDWFQRITNVYHADQPDVWKARLEKTGFWLEKCWHYFSPQAMRVLEWGHYFGLPSLLIRKITNKWILVPKKWNLWLTEQYLEKFAIAEPIEDGVFTFYIARNQP